MLVVGLIAMWPLCCLSLVGASNHQELDPPLALQLPSLPATLQRHQSTSTVWTDEELQLRENNNEHAADPELSKDQVELLRQIVSIGINASDYLFDVFEPHLYKEGIVLFSFYSTFLEF